MLKPALRKVFFSEEKKQKTFIFPLAQMSGHGFQVGRRRENKSFLVLFFKKEHSCLSVRARPMKSRHFYELLKIIP
jgi:hypothetical protein